MLLVGGFVLLWASGLRSLGMWLQAAWSEPEQVAAAPTALPATVPAAKVALLYCTADDFDASAVISSSKQSVPTEVVVLDDSMRPEVRARIDVFAAAENARVIRRSTRSGFKAGNINHAMRVLADEYEFVVILDSDSILSSDFVERALAVCARDPGIGIVQSRIEAAAGTTRFGGAMAGLLGTHIQVTQAARSRIGFAHLLGRGALVRTACLTAAGGVPEVVMEDVALTVAARRAGYRVGYLPGVVTVEEYPIDYEAFRVQYRKTVEGAMELLLSRAMWARRTGLAWWERIDLAWELANAPLASAAGAVIAGAGVLLAADGSPLLLPLWAAAVTSVMVSAPLLPESLRILATDGLLPAARFLGAGSLLYGSTMLLAVGSAARVLVGRSAVFRITPKTPSLRSLRSMCRFAPEVAVAAVSAAVALRLTGSVLPVLPLLLPAVAASALAIWGRQGAPVVETAPLELQRSGA